MPEVAAVGLPRTTCAGVTAGIAASRSAFLERIAAASKPVGGSMATNESNENICRHAAAKGLAEFLR
jgi:hypothetical protein